jgi:hypothetical protein
VRGWAAYAAIGDPGDGLEARVAAARRFADDPRRERPVAGGERLRGRVVLQGDAGLDGEQLDEGGQGGVHGGAEDGTGP